MSRIEVIFGGILVLAVIAAGSFVLFQNGFSFPSINSAPTRAAHAAPADDAVFTGVRETDLCTCYETGFQKGTERLSIESVDYRGGYSSCRAELGPEGGEAWTEGWTNGASNKLAQRSCRLFLKKVSAE